MYVRFLVIHFFFFLVRATNATREKDGWSVYATIEWQMVCNGLGVHCNTFHCEQVVSIRVRE